ncbi:hypothetical protein [Paenibacillus polymyxa]|uniref:hypothetical protein n=1 Tax=Paenibacillus TaxID=44249 RepID=UPI00077CD434|nr:hypothetical protein [Paenibacillus polymyxa]AOK92042.1 hypothetical protein AOU00_20820 [Paenibacillus polymyxa]KYG92803.1 hypothetical protein AZE31_02810 [Paenibacillus polymyxa]URJ41076.1 hypothetical protein MF627_000613 [Paenibacillus polymyxa]
MKKILTVSLSAALMLSLSATSFADNSYIANAEQSISATQDQGNADGNEVKDTCLITPMDVITIPAVHHIGKGAFKDFFTLSPQNGKKLNIYTKNNGSSTVYLSVKVNGQDFGETTIPAGGQKTRNFEQLVGIGLSGNYKVYIYNNDGSLYDLNISARQF